MVRIATHNLDGLVAHPRGVLGVSGKFSGYDYSGLSLMGLITLTCMGYALVRYIGIDYRKSYRCPIETRLFDHISGAINTLCLCTVRANELYKQCVDHKVATRYIGGIT